MITTDASASVSDASPFVGIDARTMIVPGKLMTSGGRFRARARGVEGQCYHVMSRTCGGEMLFGDIEREALQRLMWKMAAFLGVEVLTYAVMGNHFHGLIEVPHQAEWLKRFDGPQGEEALLKHLGTFYGKGYVAGLRRELEALHAAGNEHRVRERLAPLKRRFCDLSIFCKELKERFSRWFNKRAGRKGTLWMAPFKSVLVENGPALRTIAAYIDLNPVRAGLVEDPKDYRWSGYGEAMSGSQRARQGLCRVLGVGLKSWSKPMPQEESSGREKYRVWLYSDGKERVDRAGKVSKAGFSRETSERVAREEKGKLSMAEILRTRTRQFSQGVAVGSRAWIESIFAANKDRFGPKRKTGARKLGASDAELWSMRDLG